ncbi:ABC transporter permease [Psychrobacillus sp. PGGUH221]|uniref:ABC transporter permease n=1 Tax=Psychrobacillus sp. PGGUH221 TaxID=3020058 RepID=UPI0035C741DF
MKRFFYQSFISYKALYGYLDFKLYLLFKVVTPIFQLLFFSLIAKHVYDSNDITPWVLGNALLLSMYNSLFGVGAVLVSERSFGTLKSLIASPTNNFYLFVSRGFIHILDSLLTVFLGLFTGFLIFDLDFSNTNFIHLLICILITMFASMGMGLLISSVGLLLTDLNLILNFLVFILMLFTGAIFPISYLPEPLQYISEFIPITNGLSAGRAIVDGVPFSDVVHLLLKEFIIGLIYTFLGYLSFIITERLARIRGNIDIY